jgi:hypothetical protein
MSLIRPPHPLGFIGCGAVDPDESLGNLQGVFPAAILGRSFSAYAGLTSGCDRAFRRGNRPRSHTLVGVGELLLVFKGSPVRKPAIESCHWRACMVNEDKRTLVINGCGKNPSRSKLPPRFQLPSLARLRAEQTLASLQHSRLWIPFQAGRLFVVCLSSKSRAGFSRKMTTSAVTVSAGAMACRTGADAAFHHSVERK